MQPIKIYLDSSDYSTLSKSDMNDAESSVLDCLRHRILQGDIECFYSGIHLSEMAPVDPAYAAAANRRTELLSELCGKKALISQDQIFSAELKSAFGASDDIVNVYSYSGEWYPFDTSDILPEVRSLNDQIQDAISECTTNRKDRRMAEKKYSLKGKAREALISQIKSGVSSIDISAIASKYPMRQVDIDVLAQYTVGNASYEEASMAFTYSLQNPIWMMKWFEKNHEKLDSLIAWTRRPSRDMVEVLNATIIDLELLREKFPDKGGFPVSAKLWATHQDSLLVTIAEKISKRLQVQGDFSLTTEVVDIKCPGLSAGVRSVHSAWKTSLQKNTRMPKSSDFTDALHAVYAPYVDIFRADAFMAPYIKDASREQNVMVVPKLLQLPKAIEGMLASRILPQCVAADRKLTQ